MFEHTEIFEGIIKAAKGRKIVLVLDMDETVWDTSPLHAQLHNNAICLLWSEDNILIPDGHRLTRTYLNQTNYVREAFQKHHGIPIETTVQTIYDPKYLNFSSVPTNDNLSHALACNTIPTYIFTNAPSHFSRHALSHIKLLDHFNSVVCTDDLDYQKKEQNKAYALFMEKTNLCLEFHMPVFVDNTVQNLLHAHKNGWFSIHSTEYLKSYPYHESVPAPGVRGIISDLSKFIHGLNQRINRDAHPDRTSSHPGNGSKAGHSL